MTYNPIEKAFLTIETDCIDAGPPRRPVLDLNVVPRLGRPLAGAS